MFIQVNTDHSIQSHEDVTRFVEEVVNSKLRALSGRITRVEVHLGDENAQKGGADDKRCMVEARIEGRPPTAVTHHDETLKKAVTGAAEKLRAALDSELGKLSERR